MQITQRPYTAPKMAARAQVKPQAKPVFKGQIDSRLAKVATHTAAGIDSCTKMCSEIADDLTKDCPDVVKVGVGSVYTFTGFVTGAVAGFASSFFDGDDD